MAKAAASKTKTKVKVVKVRKTRSEIKSIDDKYYGSEPIVVDTADQGKYRDALNWYNYMFDHEQARDWLLEYMKRSGFERTQIADIRRCPKYRVPTTIGWQSRMMMNGNKLSESSMSFFNQHLDTLFTIAGQTKEETPKAERAVVSIQERTQAKIQLLITECEEALDANPTLNVYEWLTGKEAAPMAANAIRDYYVGNIADFEYEDEFATRAEKKHNAEQLKYWTEFVNDCDRYVGNKKAVKVRKPREKKTKSAVDLVSKLKYQKEFPQLKIVSINPAEIVGAQQLWTYNTKYNKLSRYDALGPNGLQVKGTTLIGFDEEKSSTKKLRKADVALQSLLRAGKVALRTFMADLKTSETKPQGRINMDVILLRVIK